jgi:hypothetical protein
LRFVQKAVSFAVPHHRWVTAAGESFDEARTFRRVAQYFADFVDGGVEVVIDVDEGVGPEAFLQFFAAEDIAGAFEQDG